MGEESIVLTRYVYNRDMTELKINQWPYDGVIGLKEGNDLHIIDHWCYLGTVQTETKIASLLDSGKPAFDKDTYMILNKALKARPEVIHINRQYSHSLWH